MWNIATGTPMQRAERPPDAAASDVAAVSALTEYQGTHFLASSLDGTVRIWEFCAAPSADAVIQPQPIATYAPGAALSSFGAPPPPPGVLSFGVSTGPAGGSAAATAEGAVDWLVVSRLGADALEIVRLAPGFEWGGTAAKTTNCRAIVSVNAACSMGDEHLVLAGSGHMIKIFRWVPDWPAAAHQGGGGRGGGGGGGW